MGIHAKLAEVAQSVDRIAKRGKNDFHKYDYATEADVSEAIRSELWERGVTFQPINVEPVEGLSFTTDKGERIITAAVTFQFVDSESGEGVHVKTLAQGGDKGDKAAYKLMTGAVKYALLKTFLIPTGDDPERENPGYSKTAAPKSKPVARKAISDPAKEEPAAFPSEATEEHHKSIQKLSEGYPDYGAAAFGVAEAMGKSGEAMQQWISERKNKERSLEGILKKAAKQKANRDNIEAALSGAGLDNLLETFNAAWVD